ncbi:MAG TPA: YiiD C-terminal domain-containing protein [Steroidobacteraceae bacterium]|jgi:thioesterase domain-containing protein|nr:YiiD C-terminal domain-containing protein [Steroidobacteraceae bacterium]
MNAAAVLDSAAGFEHYLHQSIPLSRAMQVTVVEVTDERVILSAPLEPNINHLGTVFGGSACALATLSAWSLLHRRLQSALPAVSLVLQSSSMNYRRPIAAGFSAHAQLAPDASWGLFLRTLERRGRARITATARLLVGDEPAAHFVGEFVALSEAPRRSGLARLLPGSH